MKNVAPLYEGAEGGNAAQVIERATDAVGRPKELASLVIDVLIACGTGIQSPLRAQLDAACGEVDISTGTKKKILPFTTELQRLYADPTVGAFLFVIRRMLEIHRETPWKPRRWDMLLVLSDRRLLLSDEPLDALPEVIQIRKDTYQLPRSFISTIHRVKGREFDEIVLPYAGASTFPDAPDARRLARPDLQPAAARDRSVRR